MIRENWLRSVAKIQPGLFKMFLRTKRYQHDPVYLQIYIEIFH